MVLLSRADLAERFNVSLATIDRLRKDPTFPEPARLGGSVRWREQDVDDWVGTRIPRPGPTRGRRKSAQELLS